MAQTEIENTSQVSLSAELARSNDKIAKSKMAFVMPSYLEPPKPKPKSVATPDSSPSPKADLNASPSPGKDKDDTGKDWADSAKEPEPPSASSKDPNRKPKKLYKHGKPDLPDVSELSAITELECGCKCDLCIDYYKKCIVMRDQLYAAQCSLRTEKTAMKETIEMVKVYEADNSQKYRDLDITLTAEKAKTKRILEDIAKERKVHLEVVYKIHGLEEQCKQLENENARSTASIAVLNQKIERLQFDKLTLAEKIESLNKSNMNAFAEMAKYEVELARLEELNSLLRCQLADIDKISGGQIQKLVHNHHANASSSLLTKSMLKAGNGRSQQVTRDSSFNSGYNRVSISSPAPIQQAAAMSLDNRSSYQDIITNTNKAMNEKPTLLMHYSKGYK